MWIGNEKTMLVHEEDCENALMIFGGRVEFDELYHALGLGYHEAGCCLTDSPYYECVRDAEAIKSHRLRLVSDGCAICNETRCTEMAHVVPRSTGGKITVPLCPTHHRAYDNGCLKPKELKALAKYGESKRGEAFAAQIASNHGAARMLTAGGYR